MQTLNTSHQRQRSTLGNFIVSNAAALGHSFPPSVLNKLNPTTKRVSPSALQKLIDSISAHSSRAPPSRHRPPALSKAAAEKMISSALNKGREAKDPTASSASASLSAAIMKSLSSSSASSASSSGAAAASSSSAPGGSSSSAAGAGSSSAGYLKQEEVDTLLKLLEELLENVKQERTVAGSHGSGRKVDPSKLKARVDQLTNKNFKELEAKFKAWVDKLPAEMKEAKVMTAEALKEQKEKLKRKAREQAEKEVEKEIKSGKLK